MILNDIEIKKLIKEPKAFNKKPLIENFNEENLEGATYDVTINSTIHSFKKETATIDLKENRPYERAYNEEKLGEEGYVLAPNEYILVSINETLNLPDDVVCEVLPKTKLIRAGLILSSQYCNPSYFGKLQLGLHNSSPNSVKIYSNLKIGQFIFKRLTSIPENLYRNKKTASYQDEREFRGAKFTEEDIVKGEELLNKLRKSLGDS